MTAEDEDGAELLPVLVTPRLRLRCFRPEDAPALSANLTPPVIRWLTSWPDPVTVEVAARRIAEAREGARQGWHVGYAIERLSDGRLIGGFGGGAPDGGVEIGYHLAEHAQGQGYMLEAARAGLAAMWDLLPTPTIVAQAHPDNGGSRAILTRLGMRMTGEGPAYAPARGIWEPGCFYEIARP